MSSTEALAVIHGFSDELLTYCVLEAACRAPGSTLFCWVTDHTHRQFHAPHFWHHMLYSASLVTSSVWYCSAFCPVQSCCELCHVREVTTTSWMASFQLRLQSCSSMAPPLKPWSDLTSVSDSWPEECLAVIVHGQPGFSVKSYCPTTRLWSVLSAVVHAEPFLGRIRSVWC